MDRGLTVTLLPMPILRTEADAVLAYSLNFLRLPSY